ncbi:MAG: DNA-3-methyladenine glycosylase I [Lachnospiraceae bacterium]|nr:DNA-3-methyladenine glycosylase I [Lachnospiraceae bacterium]
MGYCSWAEINELNRRYHDTEWGVPVHDDRQMFEHLTLECLQCGLSWDLMLKKREIFRECFDDFEPERIAAYSEEDVERIMNTESMIRSPRKIRAVINNARRCMELREEFGGICDYFWSFSGGKTILYQGHDTGLIPVSNGLSERISRDLKKRGFKYVGPVTIYSHLQACGIINDHDRDCPCRKRIIEGCPTIRKRRDSERG